MALEPKSIEQVLQDLAEALAEQGSEINDLNDGSKLQVLTSALARPISDLWRALAEVQRDSNIATATGDSLDLLVNTFGMFRKKGNQASGSMIALPKSPGKVAKVPRGEIFTYNGGILVATEETTLGAPYSIVPIQAGAIGVRWNLPGGTELTPVNEKLAQDFTFLVGNVLNAQGQAVGSLSGGEDAEQDFEVRSRFADYIQSLTRATYRAVYQAVLGISGIKSLVVLDNHPMVGFISIFVDDGSSNQTISTSLKNEIDTTLLEWRAAGVGVRVRPLEKVTDDIILDVLIDRTVAPAIMEEAITLEITKVFNAYPQGKKLYLSRITDVAFNVPGVLDVKVLNPGADIAVQEFQVFRPRSVTVHAHT